MKRSCFVAAAALVMMTALAAAGPQETGALVDMIRSVKKDTVTAELQKRFFDDAAKPLKTKPFVKK